MKPFLGILSILATILTQTLSAAPQAGTPPIPIEAKETALAAVFRDDARLRTKITLAVKNEPIGTVLDRLGRQLHVSLTAGTGTADDKVTLFFEDRPAAEVLSLLARHFDFRWDRLFRGYELRQDARERQREVAWRQADRDAEWQEVQSWVARLAPLVNAPPARLQDRAKELAASLQDPQLAADERTRLTTEAAAIRDALRPETAPAVALLRGLTVVQVAQLRRDENLLLARENGTLPAAVPKLTRKAEGDTDTVPENRFTRPPDGDAQVRIWSGWYFGGPPRPIERRSALSVTLAVRLEGPGNRRWDEMDWSPRLPPKEHAAPAATQTADPVLLRTVKLSLPPSVARSARPAGKPGDALAYLRSRTSAVPRLSDLAEAIHQNTGLEIVADSFIRDRVDASLVAERRPLAQLLDALAQALDYSWQKEGNVLLLRSRSRHWDRAVEVPDRVLRPWQERVARSGIATLDDLAEIVADLDDLPLLGLSQYWDWYLQDPWVAAPQSGGAQLYVQRRQLRFWARLSPAQRQQALSGAVLGGDQMSATQRQAFLTALTDPFADLVEGFHAGPVQPGSTAFLISGRRPTPSDLLTGGFRITTAGWRLQLFSGAKADGSTDQIVAFHPAYRPPVLSNLPRNAQWTAMGDPIQLDQYTFAYYLDGKQEPARTVDLMAGHTRT